MIIFNIRVHVGAILEKQVHRANVESILYDETPIEMWKIKHRSRIVFNITAMMAPITKKTSS